ncbi:MAG TPA: DUF448 domain-containing protein [Geobacteraceae bacterium]|nr:DUF448 domain-containing protein [Geobacteraceae bacterium]
MAKADPQRSCLGCREVKPKEELLRFVLDPDGNVVPDLAKKLPGRGGYTCYRRSCLEAAVRKRQFSRSFKGEAKTLPSEEMLTMVTGLQEERVVSTIAMANKAGRVVSGSDKVMDALRKGNVSLLILAEDISGESAAKFLAIAGKTGVESFRFSLKERLGSPLGKDIRSVVAVAPGPFADSLRRELTRYGNFFEGGAE